AVHGRRSGPLVRPGDDPETRVHRAVLRLDLVHPVEVGADGLRGQRADAGRAGRNDHGPGGPAQVVSDRLRPAAQPDRGRELPDAELALRPALPAWVWARADRLQ